MEKILLNNESIEYSIIKSNRKSLGIRISLEKGIQVLLPKGCSKKYAEKLMYEKSEWILSHWNKIKNLKQDKNERRFKEGEKLLYIGKEHGIVEQRVSKENTIIEFNGKNFIINSNVTYDKDIIKEAFLKFYRERANSILKDMTLDYAKKLGLTVGRITIKNVKSIWGSCSSKNNINYNIMLIMAPLPIIEYVIVHELCHLVHHNHSKDFWSLLESIIPDYKARKIWLKNNGHRLNLDYLY